MLRVGISLGDVIVDGNDLYGNGVNVAARMESLANPGEICVSANVYEHVVGSIEAEFEDLGEQAVKNLPRPLRCYRLASAPVVRAAAAAPSMPEAPASLALPDKPSIAVLPFTNMSGSAEQEFFADGMTEDLITDLSRLPSLFVIARNSTFAYKGQSPDIRTVGRELGVRYVLEGSIRQSGCRIRVTAQLIEALNGTHLWAGRFDRDLDDIFAVQDELTSAIIAEVAPEIEQAELDCAMRRPPQNLDAWSLYQRGLSHAPSGEEADLRAAIDLFDHARKADPNFVEALAMAGNSRVRYSLFFHGAVADRLIDEARELARDALRMDRGNPLCCLANAYLHLYLKEYETAVSYCQEAIGLNPSSARAHDVLGFCLSQSLRPAEALEALENAERLSPRDPQRSGRYISWAVALFQLEDYRQSLDLAIRASHSENPRYWGDAIMLAAAVALGDEQAIANARQTLYRRKPDFTLADISHFSIAPIIERLRQAGVSES